MADDSTERREILAQIKALSYFYTSKFYISKEKKEIGMYVHTYMCKEKINFCIVEDWNVLFWNF